MTTEYCRGQSRLNYADFGMSSWFHCPYSIAFQTGNQIKYQGLLQSVSIHTNDKAASISCYLFILQCWGPNLGPHKANAFCVKIYLIAMWVHWITQWSKYRFSDEEDKLWARNPCASWGFTFFFNWMSKYFRPNCNVILDKSCNLSEPQLPQPEPKQWKQISSQV